MRRIDFIPLGCQEEAKGALDSGPNKGPRAIDTPQQGLNKLRKKSLREGHGFNVLAKLAN
jgi:hypothetical protein